MIIRSRYRVRLLSVIARYKYLPIKNTEVLLKYYPELGDRKKLLKTLYNFAYEGLIKKVDSGEECSCTVKKQATENNR